MSVISSNKNSVRAAGPVIAGDRFLQEIPERGVFFLVTEAREYYRDTARTHFQLEDLVWISPQFLSSKPESEIKEMLTPAKALLLDWSINSANLLTALRKYRHKREIPILALCSEQETEHVAALIMGADETISRPFNPIMLDAKLVAYRRSIEENLYDEPTIEPGAVQRLPNNSLSRPASPRDTLETLFSGLLRLDISARAFYIEDRPIRLTPVEFELLAMMMKHAGTCLKRDDIIDQVWGISHDTGTNFLDVHIYALRQKMKKAGVPPCIITVRGVGYRLEPLA